MKIMMISIKKALNCQLSEELSIPTCFYFQMTRSAYFWVEEVPATLFDTDEQAHVGSGPNEASFADGYFYIEYIKQFRKKEGTHHETFQISWIRELHAHFFKQQHIFLKISKIINFATLGDLNHQVMLNYQMSVFFFAFLDILSTVLTLVAAYAWGLAWRRWQLIFLLLLLGPSCGILGAKKLKRPGLVVLQERWSNQTKTAGLAAKVLAEWSEWFLLFSFIFFPLSLSLYLSLTPAQMVKDGTKLVWLGPKQR